MSVDFLDDRLDTFLRIRLFQRLLKLTGLHPVWDTVLPDLPDFFCKCRTVRVGYIKYRRLTKNIFQRTLEIEKWPLVKNFSLFVCSRTFSLTPPVPDVNLRLILTKVHMRLLEPFNRYWQHNRGEKVDYALKKNRRDLLATGFSCHVTDSRLRTGKKLTFDCFLVRQLAEFGDSRQPALFCTQELDGSFKAIEFLIESKVFGKICPTQDETQSDT